MRFLSFLAKPAACQFRAPGILLVLLLALSSWFYHDSITLYPSFLHAWAQADWLALALQFRARGYDFFHPATFNLLTDEAVTGAGFPVPAYLAALLMGLTGHDAPSLLRGVTLAASLGGLLALFGLVRRASRSVIKGGVAALFAFCSPIYVYYQANFLPSVPACAAALVGYYWFYRAVAEAGNARTARRRLAGAVAWLTLAAAMRAPFALPLLCTLGHLVVLRPRRTAATVGWQAVALIYGAAFAGLAVVFFYNEHLSRAYHGSMFLARPRPFTSWTQAVAVTKTVREYWLWSLLSKPQWLLLLLAGGAAVAQHGRRLLHNEWAGHGLALAAGGVAYYGLMGPLFAVHDYYLLDAFFLPLVLGFGAAVAAWPPAPTQPAWRRVVLSVALLLSAAAAWRARAEQLRRISPPGGDKSVLTRDNFLPSARWLDSLGVPRSAKLLVLDAYSYNLPLLLAQRQGWTVLKNRNSPENLTPGNLRRALALPADYVLTQNATYGPEVVNVFPAVAAHLRPVADNGRLTLWRIRPVPLQARWQRRPTQWPYRQTTATLALRAGEQLLVAARYQAEPAADAQLVVSLAPGPGGPPYWCQPLACRPTRPGDWEPLGAAFRLPAPRAPTDVLQVSFTQTGAGKATIGNAELSLLPRAPQPGQPAEVGRRPGIR